MKLLYITNGINGSGGLERVLSVKASVLADKPNYEVHILCLNNTHLQPFYAFNPKINLFSIDVELGGNPIRFFRNYKKKVQAAVNRIQPDIISVCDDGLKGFFVPRMLKTKAKIIYERHASITINTDDSLKGRFMRKLMRSQVTRFDKFVVLTSGNIKEWNKHNVIAIPNPLSFRTNKKSSLNQKRIISVGSLAPNKGTDLLVEIWSKVEQDFPDWKLVVFGRKDKEERYAEMARDLGLKHIYFYDPVKNIQQEYLDSSIFVLPSRNEGFGMVIIEAMECGVPPVSFDCPSGPADIIKHGEDGFLIAPQDTEAFANQLKELMKDDELRVKMGTVAKQNVKRYTPEKIVEQWDHLFAELLQ